MGVGLKKGTVGAKRNFISREKAIKKLRLSAKEFRRLCILKGVYPADVKNNSEMKQRASSGKVYYRSEDVHFLSHEPIIWKFWDMKIFMKKLKRLKARKEIDRLQSLQDNRPFYRLSHIVKERYPVFDDALKDLDDCLSMLFMYGRFAASPKSDQELVHMSRKLVVQFMHYVIHVRCLRKAFISVKGYYFQAEVSGQLVTWITPHEFSVPKFAAVDFVVMKSFTEFYVQLMGFVNFKLYSMNNILYPPKPIILSSGESQVSMTDLIEALNHPLVKKEKIDEEQQPDKFEDEEVEDGEKDVKSAAGLTYGETVKLQNLFVGLKFFLNREVPRETFTFLIRSFGGDVSWHTTIHAGATYNEDDPKITHQIVDREVKEKRIDRVYVQPQWLFDCVNCRQLLPVQDYFPGCKLPPHLSPFLDEDNVREGTYVTPDVARLRGQPVLPVDDGNEEANDGENEEKIIKKKKKKKEGKVTVAKSSTSGDKVQIGKQTKQHKELLEKQRKEEEKRLAVMAIPKKKKRLYDRIMKLRKKKAQQSEKLLAKRKDYERKERVKKSTQQNVQNDS